MDDPFLRLLVRERVERLQAPLRVALPRPPRAPARRRTLRVRLGLVLIAVGRRLVARGGRLAPSA